jgi:ATP-dependent exoDNAse (exonuclease V) alpha subunit
MENIENEIEVTDEYREVKSAIDVYMKPVFVTGQAGTGKSTLIQWLTEKYGTIPILAPTGVAAQNVGGQTIHSFFMFPPHIINPRDIKISRNYEFFQSLRIMIIDEISMVRADMMDNINESLRLNRRKDLPFGGVKMIFIGDMFQLSPVVAHAEEKKYLYSKYESPLFMHSEIIKRTGIKTIELTKVFRQKDKDFISLLSNIREGQDLTKTLAVINGQYDMWASIRKDSKTIKLTPTNALADEINETELAAIDSPEFTYVGEVAENFDQKRFPAPLNLKLKVGARIMFIKNDAEKRYVNGSMGTITSLADDKIEAVIDGWDNPILVKKESWESIKYVWGGKKKKNTMELPSALPVSPLKNEQVSDDVLEELDKGEISHEVTGQYKQYPITPAWAVTIHKSQSKTFDSVNVMINGNIFADGQLYVALSRCRTLQGIMISRPIKIDDILVNQDVVKFYDTIRKQREALAIPVPGLLNADPNCVHNEVAAPGGGVKCTKCGGWFCF